MPALESRTTALVVTVANKVLLQQELRVLVSQINVQIKAVEKALERDNPGESPYACRYSDGHFIMPELLLAKAQALNGIAALEGSGR